MNKLILSVALCALLTGCLEPEPVKTSAKEAQALVNAMTYAKASNGLCFGVATVKKLNTNGDTSMSIMAVQVDCSAVGLAGG